MLEGRVDMGHLSDIQDETPSSFCAEWRAIDLYGDDGIGFLNER